MRMCHEQGSHGQALGSMQASGELSGTIIQLDDILPLKRRLSQASVPVSPPATRPAVQLGRQRSTSRINLTRSRSRPTVAIPKVTTTQERVTQAIRQQTFLKFVGLISCILVSCVNHHYMGGGIRLETVKVPVAGLPGTRIVALPDLHGDYEGAMHCLEMGGVIDRVTGIWIAGADTVVQLGDIVDRGPDSVRLSHRLIDLQSQAKQAGGRLELLLGNHELLYMRKDFSYANEDELLRIGNGNATLGLARYKQMFAPTGDLGSQFQHRRVAWRAGRGNCRSLFVHAGLQPQYLHNATNLDDLNENAAHDMLLEALYHTRAASAEIFQKDGPLRFRGYSQGRKADICPPMVAMLKKLGVHRMIVGHTLQHHGPRTRCNGQLVLMDVGVSRAMTGRQLVWECDRGEINFLFREHADQVEGNVDY